MVLPPSQRNGPRSIANSDAEAYTSTDAAIDQGYRAVQELLTFRT